MKDIRMKVKISTFCNELLKNKPEVCIICNLVSKQLFETIVLDQISLKPRDSSRFQNKNKTERNGLSDLQPDLLLQ